MKLFLSISCCLTLVALTSHFSINAQDTSQVALKEVEVHASRQSTSYFNAPKSISVITQEQIKSSAATSLPDLLDETLGVDIRQRGPFGVQADVSLRGGTFDQVLILIDGININDPQTGHHNMDLPLDLNDIKRIEVVRGGSSSAFGASAFSGVINIITKDPSKREVNASVIGGQHNLWRGALEAGGKTGDLSGFISATSTSSDGYQANTDFATVNVFGKVSWKMQRGAIHLLTGITSKGFGAQNFYSTLFPVQYEATQTRWLALQAADSVGHIHFKASGYYRQHRDRFELFRETGGYYSHQDGYYIWRSDTVPGWYSGPNFHLTQVYGGNFNASFHSKLGHTSIGYEYRNEKIQSNVLGNPLSESIAVPGWPGNFYTKGRDRFYNNVYLQHRIAFHKLAFDLGAVLSAHSDFGTHIFPGADVSYQLNAQNLLFTGYHRSYRTPTYTDLYYNQGGAMGSATLQPEYANSFEAGWRWMKPRYRIELSAFDRECNNLIDWIKPNSSNEVLAANITSVRFYGAEFSGSLTQHFFEKMLPWVKSIGINYTYQDANRTSAGFESAYALDLVPQRLGASVALQFGKHVLLNANLENYNRKGGFTTATSTGEVPYPSVSLLSAKFTYKIKTISLFVSGNNLLNQRVYDVGGVELPGRWMYGGISMSWE